MYFEMSVWGVRISRCVPVNDPRYSVNEGCFSDLLHTSRRAQVELSSIPSAFHHSANTKTTADEVHQRKAEKKKIGFSFYPFHKTSVETDMASLLETEQYVAA